MAGGGGAVQRSRGGWPGLAQIHCRKRGGGVGDGCCCCLAKFSTKLRAAAAQVDIEQICEQYIFINIEDVVDFSEKVAASPFSL